jgi:RNA polymerase sigma-B factor
MATEERAGGRIAWDREHTRELFARYRAGDAAAREELVLCHLNLVRFLAAKFVSRGEPMEDLVQVGTIGLIKAIDRFEPERGLEFTSYATPTVLGEIKRHFRDKGWSVRVPRRLQELSARITQTTDLLTQRLQHTPTVDEIAEYLGVSVEEVLDALESGDAYASVPLDARMSEDEDSAAVIDRFGQVDGGFEALDDRLYMDQLLATFPAREREILRLRFDENLTQAQIADRLNLSQVQVSRLLRRTLKALQDKMVPLNDVAAR